MSGCSRDFGYEYGLLPNEEIEEDKFDEIWGELGNEFKSKFLAMMPVTPYYIVVVSCSDHNTVDDLELELPIRGYVAAKRTSLDSWRGYRQRSDFAWTMVTGGIRCCPAFVEDRKRVNDTDDGLNVLAE